MNGTTAAESFKKSDTKHKTGNSWTKRLVFSLLSRLEHGCLVVRDGKQSVTFGLGRLPRARVTIKHPDVYRRILFGGSIGAGEAYIDNQWEVDDLTALSRIMTWVMTSTVLFSTPP